MKPDFTTRRGIDAEIMRLRRVITLHEDDYDQVQEISYEINELRILKEALAKPWQKPRPAVEASLMRYGVTV